MSTSKIIYDNHSADNFDVTKLLTLVSDLQTKVQILEDRHVRLENNNSKLQTQVNSLEKTLQKPKYNRLHELFVKLDLMNLYPKFEKEKIDYETLIEICESNAFEQLEKLIPTTGEFFRFVRKIKNHLRSDFEKV